jgi:virginiamycin B lyase
MELREITLPWADARPRRIALTSDGTVWYGDYSRGTLGRLDPATGNVTEFPLPSGKTSLPYAIMSDDQDRIWVVETGIQPNRFVAFDPKTQKFSHDTAVPSGAGTIRHMEFDPRTGRIWFGTDNNTIGYAQVRPPRIQP